MSDVSPAADAGADVGLVHDYLLVMRGAERSFAAIADCWPQAPIHTLLYDKAGTDGRFSDRRVDPLYLQRLGVGQRGFRRLLPLFPRAAERLPVQRHDVLVSSSSAFAHGARPRPDAMHVCYCYTPFRYAWHERERALAEVARPLRSLLDRTLTGIRAWDVEASRRVTHYVAISELARQRIADCYGRDSTVIHPPVQTERFAPGTPEDFLLVVTELVPHKRVELALHAADLAGRPIKVVGEGPDRDRLAMLYPRADFVGRISDELAVLYSRAQALVVPNIEEFGIAAVEAQAAGRPVLAANAGGARETVIDGETGVLVPPDDIDALAEAMREVDFARFHPSQTALHASRFSTEAFRARFKREVDRCAAERR